MSDKELLTSLRRDYQKLMKSLSSMRACHEEDHKALLKAEEKLRQIKEALPVNPTWGAGSQVFIRKIKRILEG